jgi:hypothetical protein
MRFLTKHGICLFALMTISVVAYSQPGPPATGPGPGGCFPPPCIPIDGGLSLLIAAGIGLAGKKAYDHHKDS